MHLNILGEDEYRLGLDTELVLIAQLVDERVGALPGVVNLVFCGDETVQQLNRDHRQKDKVTDVLTFTYYCDSSLPPEERSLDMGDPQELLGEVILGIDQTKRQAEEEGWPLKMELFKLFIHGLLHMRGFDHEREEDFRVMKLHEDEIMKSFLESQKN